MDIGNPAYWDTFYKELVGNMVGFECFDWYCTFDQLFLEIIQNMLDPTIVHKILIIGIGRSSIIDSLYRKGHRDITAIDISETIIVEMQRKYHSFSGVEFFVMDTRQLHKFADDTFTFIFDKGCIDALFCSTDFMESSSLAFKEIYRVMAMDGLCLHVTHAPAVARVPYLRCSPWAIDRLKIPSHIGEGLTLFILVKTTNEILLGKKIPGAEAAVRSKSSRVVSNSDQQMNKSSTTKKGNNTGSLTVTASVDFLAEMVAESADVDS
jgi:hypothetical protein